MSKKRQNYIIIGIIIGIMIIIGIIIIGIIMIIGIIIIGIIIMGLIRDVTRHNMTITTGIL